MTGNISDNKKKILEALENCRGIVSDACKSAKISRKTFYEWLKKDSDFKSEVDSIQEPVLDYVEGKLFKLIEDENPAAIFFYLKCKGQSRGYIEKQVLTHEGGITLKFDHQDEKV